MSNLVRQLNGDEGRKSCVYQDHLGFWTIGVGRLVDPRKPGAGLRPKEMDFLLANDIEDRVQQLATRLPWFTQLDEARQGVLLNMSFQLGVDGLLGFKNTLELVRTGKYLEASTAMLQSKWAGQTPERAERLSKQMASGVWQFAPGA
ncbi:lysozyme [Bacteriophage sp.]|nr:lysozyme [Caudoviricetes sp.]UOF79978.1 lysozyme [Bacteriophage sp.]